MAKNINFSICLTDIGAAVNAGHGAISVSAKNGKKYANITMWVNDEADKFGNDLSLQLNSREAGDKKVYVGNAKQPEWMKAQGGAVSAPVQQAAAKEEYEDNLPF